MSLSPTIGYLKVRCSVSVTVLWILLHFAPSGIAKQPPAATVVSLNGTAHVSNRRLSPGDSLFEGDIVRTGIRSGIKLLLSNKAIVDLGPEATFEITIHKSDPKDTKTEVKLELGRAKAAILKKLKKKQRFHIRTRSSVLAVRGTELVISISRRGNRYEESCTVARGSIEVFNQLSAQGQGTGTLLRAGNQITTLARFEGAQLVADPQSPTPSIRSVEPAEVQAIVEESSVIDQTFEQAVVIDESPEPSADSPDAGLADLENLGEAIAEPERDVAAEEESPPVEIEIPNPLSPEASTATTPAIEAGDAQVIKNASITIKLGS